MSLATFSSPDARTRRRCRNWSVVMFSLVCFGILTGCGTTKNNSATEQMLNSGAVDAAVAKIDFTPLKGQHVYFDTQYIKDYKGVGFVNSDYVISSMRQQMVAAGLLLQTKEEEADYILEGRLGTLGGDSHEVVYGIPSNSALNAAASAASTLSGIPAAPSIPEMSVARRNEQAAAAKIGVFAYERVSKEAVWQSGISVAQSTARDIWFFGIGPFKRGSIYNGKTRFAGNASDAPVAGKREGYNGAIASYRDEIIFKSPHSGHPTQLAKDEEETDNNKSPGKVVPASAEEIAEPTEEAGTATLP